MPLGHVVTAARAEDVYHRAGAGEHPQPPAVALFTALVHEDQPARLVGLLIGRLPHAPLGRLVQGQEQRHQPLQAAGHGTRRDRQAQKFPGGQQPFRRPIAGVLVQQDLQPHRRAQEALGDQLGRRRRRARLATRAAAGRLIAAAADHAAVGLDSDLDLLGVLGVAPLAPGLATAGTYLLGLGKFDEFLARADDGSRGAWVLSAAAGPASTRRRCRPRRRGPPGGWSDPCGIASRISGRRVGH